MRILTVRQPWAWAIIHGGKDVENRVRNIAGEYRGSIAIHAGLNWDEGSTLRSSVLTEAMRDHHATLRDTLVGRGAIIGVVDLVDVHRTSRTPKPFCVELGVPHGLRDAVAADRRCESSWAEHDADWHLVLANPRPLPEPIPYRGGQGLRRLPADVVAQVLAATPEGTQQP